jgi:hypothetical protein
MSGGGGGIVGFERVGRLGALRVRFYDAVGRLMPVRR